jgi:hypothetical protein
MHYLGIIFLAIGILVIATAFGMDTSVSTELGLRVNNIGLMSMRSNLISIGGFIFVAGAMLLAFGSRSSGVDLRNCPMCSEPILREAIKCKHCGSSVEPLHTTVSHSGMIAPIWHKPLAIFVMVCALVWMSYGLTQHI